VPGGGKTTTTIDLKHAAALVLLGIAIGCAISHFYFAAFMDDRAEDGVPIAMGGHSYRIVYDDRTGDRMNGLERTQESVCVRLSQDETLVGCVLPLSPVKLICHRFQSETLQLSQRLQTELGDLYCIIYIAPSSREGRQDGGVCKSQGLAAVPCVHLNRMSRGTAKRLYAVLLHSHIWAH